MAAHWLLITDEGLNLSWRVLAGQEVRSQESEVTYRLNSEFHLQDNFPP